MGQYQFLIADTEGSAEKVPTTRPISELGSFVAWAPDGKWIAVSPDSHEIRLVDASSGQATPIADFVGKIIFELSWTPNGRDLFVIYRDRRTAFSRTQIGFVSVPSGELREITKDTNHYRGLSSSADGKTLTTIQSRALRSFYLFSAAGMGTELPAPILQ